MRIKFMLENRHIIHKQSAIIQAQSHEQALRLQNEIGSFLKDELPYLLEPLLDELAPPDELLRIDFLELDLGALTHNNFKENFSNKLVDAIKKNIKQQKQQAGTSRNSGVVKKKESLQEALQYFLLNGVKPWFIAARKMAQWEEEMLAQFKRADWQLTATWLQQNYPGNEVIVERLINQFSGDVLHKVVAELNSFEQHEWLTVFEDIQLVYKELSTAEKMLAEKAAWKDLFAEFLKEQQQFDALYAMLMRKYDEAFFHAKNTTASFEKNISVEEAKRNAGASLIEEKISSLQSRLKSQLVKKVLIDVHADAMNDVTAKTDTKVSKDKYAKKDNLNEDRTGIKQDGFKDGSNESISNDEIDALRENSFEDAGNVSQKNIDEKNDEQVKKNKKTIDAIEKETQYVINSGLIILHPFLLSYFDDLDLLREKKFKDVEACKRAVLLLHYLATGETQTAEFDLLLQKIICGLSFEETLPNVLVPSDKEKEESGKLLQSVINYWPPLKNTSIAGLQHTFLQRDGRLEKKENTWLLTVEQRTVDILLDKLPWGFSTIKLPWMKDMISVEWC